MSDYDAIRRALDDLVGTPPAALSRKGAVMARIETRRRIRLATQAVLGAVFLAVASAGALKVVRTEPTGNGTIFLDDDTSPSPKPDRATTKPTRSATAKPAATAQPTTPPAVAPTKPATTKPATTKPSSQPTTTKPTASGEPKTAPSLQVYLYSATEYAKAGERVDLKVKAYDGAGRVLRVQVDYGDGTSTVVEPAGACSSAGVEWRQYFPHTYGAAGTYVARAVVTTGDCGAATETRSATLEVKVGSASASPKPTSSPTATNGPAQPEVSATSSVAGAVATLALTGSDADGFVKKFVISWGDGSPDTYVGPRSLDSCTNASGTTHPTASEWQQSREHAYEAPGTYTVKVTVMSTSCAGSDGQLATTTVTVTI